MWTILDVILIWTGYVGPADGSAYITEDTCNKMMIDGCSFVDSGDGLHWTTHYIITTQ